MEFTAKFSSIELKIALRVQKSKLSPELNLYKLQKNVPILQTHQEVNSESGNFEYH